MKHDVEGREALDGPLVFPGEIAGASLKRARRHRPGQRLQTVFPGEIAGASLKRSSPGTSGRWWRAFSPAKSPGPH